MFQFPPGFPEGCPPSDTLAAHGVVYRIVRCGNLSPEDFLTHAETGRVSLAPPCMRHGLSVYRRVEDAVRTRELFPWIGSRIAVGLLCNRHGRIKSTPRKSDSHITWWVYEGVDRSVIFIPFIED